MKTPHLLAALALLSTTSALRAQFSGPGSISSFVAGLTLSHSTPGTVAKDPETGKPYPKGHEFAGPTDSNSWTIIKPTSSEEHEEFVLKIKTRKYSNKEILLDLVRETVLPEIGNPPYIAGWSLVVVTDELDDVSALYARHTNGTMVDLTGYIDLPYSEEGLSADDIKFKSVYKTVEKGDDVVETYTATDVYKYKQFVTFLWLDSLFGNGTLLGGGKLGSIVMKDDEGSYKYPLYIPGASKVSGVCGEFSMLDENDEDIFGVVEGTLSTSAGKAVPDLEAILFPDI